MRKLLCHHGHRFDAPEEADRGVVCPLCGAITKYQRRVETKGASAFDQTIKLDTPDRAGSSPTTEVSKTLDHRDTNALQNGTLQTLVFDDGIRQDPNDTESEDATTAKTVVFDKTLDLKGPLLASEDAQSEEADEADAKGELPTAEISNSEVDDAEEPQQVAKTVVIDKTVMLDRPPSSQDCPDESDVISATVDLTPGSQSDGGKFAPTALLQMLDAQTRAGDTPRGDNSSPSAKQAPHAEPEVKPPDLPGYKVLAELGRGGMGVVYRARHEKRNREVALKTLLHISPLELQRFKQEFRSLADIAHPNLAGLYDLLSDGETWCFSMEILEAVDFTEYVWSGFEALQRKKGQRLVGKSPKDAPRLTSEITERLYDGLKQLVLGLETLHQAGMLHRDIKPSNVLVTTEGRVVLVDFGLASQFEEGSDERPVGIQGTPEYMAPEQAACNPLSPASDWYAVGVMIYEILTGYFPIEGKPLSIIYRKQTDRPKPAREIDPSVPKELNNLCMSLLDIDPKKRPTAADLLRCIGADDLIESLQATSRIGGGQSLDLVGRVGHLKGLRSSFRQVVGGITKTIFVHGKSGMGKSVLIQKFLEGVLDNGQAVVLSGRCYEQESVPFKALDNLIDSLADHLTGLTDPEVHSVIPDDFLPLVRLFPVLGQIPGASDAGRPSIDNVDQKELRQRATDALREMLRRLGEQKPVVLHIDDLQWGDEDSADLLADLVRPPNSPRVLILGSYRTENRDTSFCLRAIDKAYSMGQHRPHREEIAVDSLQPEDAKRLALMLLGRNDTKSHALAATIARESGGWPFFVWELAQHVRDSSEIADQSLELDEVIWMRVGRLPAEARRLLELVAIAGRPIPATEAYQTLGSVEKGQSFLAQLRTRNFVRTTESEDQDTLVESYHDRIRESVVQHLDQATVQAHCLNLALTIECVSGIKVDALRAHIAKTADFAEPAEPYGLQKRQWQRVFDLAYFFDAAGEHDRAFTFALCAAEQARQQDAQEVAEQQYRIAFRGMADASQALRFRVHEGLGDVLVLRGRYAEAIEQFQTARELGVGKITLARIDAKLGSTAFKKGDMGEAGQYQETALYALGDRPPGNLLALIYGLAREIFVQVLHTRFPARFVGRNYADSPQGKMDLFRVRLLDELTITYWFTKRMEVVLWSHLRGLNLGERYPASQELGRTYAFHAITMTGIPMARRGIAYATKAYQISVDKGDLWGQGKARSFHTFSCIVLARFDEGVQTGKEAVQLLEQAGDVWEANMARMISTVPMFHLGDLKSAYQDAKKAYEIGMETEDFSAACISLLFWVPAAPHLVPPGAIRTELQRKRIDPLAITGAVYARGLELLLCEDKPIEAAETLDDCLARAKERGIRNVCIYSAATWKVTALRIATERATDSASRHRLLRQAGKAVRAALSITKRYRACRPHALREAGILAALKGREVQSRRYFDESFRVSKLHEARYDHARTSLARGEAGVKFNWPDAEREIAEAKEIIAAIETFDSGEPIE